MHEWWQVIWLFATAFALSAVSGIFGYLFRAKKRKFIETLIVAGYAGCTGLGISLLWHKYFGDPHMLLGICVFAGLAGATGIDHVILFVRRLTEMYDERKRGDEQ